MKKLISWNVNGIRAAAGKGLFEYLQVQQPDILCLQETKAHPDQVNEDFTAPPGYHSYWASAAKKGYSGVCTYTKNKPLSVDIMQVERFDNEGRVIVTEHDNFFLFNCYFPNSQAEGARLDYKLDFCETLRKKLDELVAAGKNVVVCGDYNIAHKPIDLENPKSNEKNPGYLPEERAWMDSFIGHGYVDTFRIFNSEPKQYSWWSYRTNAREKNVGWRIDYHCVNEGFASQVKSAGIQPEIFGSDHCPVTLELV